MALMRAEVRGHALPDVLTSGNHFGEIAFVASCKGLVPVHALICITSIYTSAYACSQSCVRAHVPVCERLTWFALREGYLRDSHAPASRGLSEREAPGEAIRVADVVAMTTCRVLP